MTLGGLVLGEIRAPLEEALPKARLERHPHRIEAVKMLVLGAPLRETALATQPLVIPTRRRLVDEIPGEIAYDERRIAAKQGLQLVQSHIEVVDGVQRVRRSAPVGLDF